MKGIVDRFAGDFVVIEVEGNTHDVKKEEVSDDVLKGDVVVWKNGMWHKDEKETQKRSRHMKSLMDSVWED